MENKASRSSCISRPASMSSPGESSWAMHFAELLASSAHSDQEVYPDQLGGGVSESSFSPSFDSLGGDDESFITSDLMDEDDEDEDDSLRDTACSSAAGPKLQVASMHDMYMKSMAAMDAREVNTAQLTKYFLAASSWQQATAGVPQEMISGGNSKEKQLYECNDLRKKGLCLVPLSMLIDYIR